MADLIVSGDNAGYKITLSNMSTSTRYHVFIADLSSSGSVTGYKCVRSSLGTSSSWTYNGSSSSTYSKYNRSVYCYTSTSATSHSVGTIYSFDEMSDGCNYMDSDTIPAAGSSPSYSTNLITFQAGTGIKSYKMIYADAESTGNTATISSIQKGIWVRENTNASLYGTPTPESGYGEPYYFVEYTDSSFSAIKKTFDEGDINVYSNGKRYIRLFATEEVLYSTNQIALRCGNGIQSFVAEYENSRGVTVSEQVTSTTTSSVKAVRDGTYLEIKSVNHKAGYDTPYYTLEYKDYKFEELKSTAHSGLSIYSNSNRYIKVFASTPYKYRIKASANGGSFSGSIGDTYYIPSSTGFKSNDDQSTFEFKLSTLPTPTRTGYLFYGWIYKNKTYTASDTLTLSASYAGTVHEFTANWVKNISIILDANGGLFYDTSPQKSTKNINLLSGSNLEFSKYSKNVKRGIFVLKGWDTDKQATTPKYGVDGFFMLKDDSPTTYYAIWKKVDLFYWLSEALDPNAFVVGADISNALTAVRWNLLNSRIKEIANAMGLSYTYTTVSAGDDITAKLFNDARTGISRLTGHGALPLQVTKGDAIKASYFHGDTSLKSALNAAITYYNNNY